MHVHTRSWGPCARSDVTALSDKRHAFPGVILDQKPPISMLDEDAIVASVILGIVELA